MVQIHTLDQPKTVESLDPTPDSPNNLEGLESHQSLPSILSSHFNNVT